MQDLSTLQTEGHCAKGTSSGASDVSHPHKIVFLELASPAYVSLKHVNGGLRNESHLAAREINWLLRGPSVSLCLIHISANYLSTSHHPIHFAPIPKIIIYNPSTQHRSWERRNNGSRTRMYSEGTEHSGTLI